MARIDVAVGMGLLVGVSMFMAAAVGVTLAVTAGVGVSVDSGFCSDVDVDVGVSVAVGVGVGVYVGVSSNPPGTVTVALPAGGSSTLVPGVYGSFSPGTGGGGAGVTEVFSYAPT